MAAFRFSLEPYHRLVTYKREQCEMDFTMKVAQMREVEEVLQQIRLRLSQLQDELDERLKSGLGIHEYRLWAARIQVLREEEDTVSQRLVELETEVERAKKRLVDAHRDERLTERLRERELSEHEKKEATRAMAELDELVAVKRGPFS